MKKTIAGILALGALGGFLQAASAADSPGRPPNILLILADDLGWSQVGFNGNPYYATPHLDGLSREGMRFTQAYSASPVCSPTRAALMTGQDPARLHLTDFIPGNPYPWARLRQPDWRKFLPLERTTIAEILSERGYVTGLVGKWHLAKGYFPPASIEEGPDRQGFQEVLITQKPVPGADPENDAHNVEAITRRSLRFLREHRQVPFFLMISHNTIHAPIMERKAMIRRYESRPGSGQPGNSPVVGAMVETLDLSVGRILAELDKLGLRDNTVVIFYSDNGGLVDSAAQPPFRGGKAQLYEGGIRVPLLVRWPGVVKPGRVESTPITTVDFLPTFSAIAGATLPGSLPLDGVNLMPLLSGHPLPARALFWHYPHYHPAGVAPSTAVRAGRWKLIDFYEQEILGIGRKPELYDLERDPGEEHDLAKENQAKVAELKEVLHGHLERVGAQEPGVNPDYDPKRAELPRPERKTSPHPHP